KVLPHNIVEILTQLYPSLSKNQKLACTYLLKEFIESDVEREWIETPNFRQQMEKFIQGMDTNMLSHMAIKTALEKFYKSKVRKEYDASEEALAFDLTKAFHHLMVRLTPLHFRGEMLAAKNSQRNSVFSAISDLTNNISHFVSIEVLSAKSTKERVRLVKYFLDVIEICLKQGIHQHNEKLIYNFAAAAAIFNGLAITQVTRLTKTWEQIDKEKLYSQRFEEYKLLFMPGAFTALRKEIAQHPDCIPLVALFGAEKDKNAEAPLMNALELNGDANRRFANHQAYLREQPQWESMPYKTNILEKFVKMYHTDNYVWALSYNINPPKVINVDSNPDLDQLLKQLGEMKMLNAPLAVFKNKNMLTGKEAFEALKRYLDKKFPKRVTLFEGNTDLQAPVSMASSTEKFSDDAQKRQAVIDLAKTVILDFDQLLQKPQIEDITQRLGAVSLKETQKRASSSAAAVDDDAPTRKRSKTLVTQFPSSSDATPRRGSFSKEQKLEMLTKGVPRDTRTELFPSAKVGQEASSPVFTLAPTFTPMASISVATSSQEGSLSKVKVYQSNSEKKAHQRHRSEVASSPRKK
ncbi:MAG: RasGEF domain-containing protein, partial [Candidatus Berkiella sp.]